MFGHKKAAAERAAADQQRAREAFAEIAAVKEAERVVRFAAAKQQDQARFDAVGLPRGAA